MTEEELIASYLAPTRKRKSGFIGELAAFLFLVILCAGAGFACAEYSQMPLWLGAPAVVGGVLLGVGFRVIDALAPKLTRTKRFLVFAGLLSVYGLAGRLLERWITGDVHPNSVFGYGLFGFTLAGWMLVMTWSAFAPTGSASERDAGPDQN